MIFQKFAKFICDCFCRGPVPREVVTNVCTASGGGSNPMRGSSCSEPTLVEATILRAADPPQCHGGDATLCSPMPLSFRVVFPCPVPGSSCIPLGGSPCDPDGESGCLSDTASITFAEIVGPLGFIVPAQTASGTLTPSATIVGPLDVTPLTGFFTVRWGVHCVTVDMDISGANARYSLNTTIAPCDGPRTMTLSLSVSLNNQYSWPSSISLTMDFYNAP